MTFKGTPPVEASSPPSTPSSPSPAPVPVPSELEIATKWDNCVESTIKSVAIGAAVTLPIFFFARAGWMRGLFLGGGIGYGLGSGIGECRSAFSRPLEHNLVRVRKPQAETTKPTNA